jgi:hypothetical protein
VDAVARVEDERFHLGIPALGLVSEMNASFQQFFYTDSNNITHNFPLVKTPEISGASRGTRDYGLMLLWPLHLHQKVKFKAVYPRCRKHPATRDVNINRGAAGDNVKFCRIEPWRTVPSFLDGSGYILRSTVVEVVESRDGLDFMTSIPN